MQMNVVTSDMLHDAMAHPENYRNLLVRIQIQRLLRDPQPGDAARADRAGGVRHLSIAP